MKFTSTKFIYREKLARNLVDTLLLLIFVVLWASEHLETI